MYRKLAMQLCMVISYAYQSNYVNVSKDLYSELRC